MQVYTIDITSWTASFRYPNLISGYQPTLDVPPLSTILGLMNAAAGTYLQHEHLQIGYYFQYEQKGVDLETIYQISSKDGRPTNQAKSNVVRREFLFNTFLRLYVTDKSLADWFREPHYQLVLGRMNDLATVLSVSAEPAELQAVPQAQYVKGQTVPFNGHHLAGQIQALPQYFTNTLPRKNLGTQAYSVINHQKAVFAKDLPTFRDFSLPGRDNHKGVDIYFHELSFFNQ